MGGRDSTGRRALAGAVQAGREAAAGYGRHACSQLAAAISYRVLFSLVPFVALVFSALELVLPEEARRSVTDWLFGREPGSDVESAVSKTVVHPGATASVAGVVALAGLLWAATGMMASIRTALGVIWGAGPPTYARGKLRDLALTGLAAVLILAGAVSVVVRLVAEAGDDLSATVGLGGDARAVGTLSQLGGSLALAFAAFAVVYRAATPVRLRFADVWPSALLAAVAVEALSAGFAFYLARVSDLSAIYGSMGAVFAFLLLVYLVAAILLFGAEVAAARASLGRAPRGAASGALQGGEESADIEANGATK